MSCKLREAGLGAGLSHFALALAPATHRLPVRWRRPLILTWGGATALVCPRGPSCGLQVSRSEVILMAKGPGLGVPWGPVEGSVTAALRSLSPSGLWCTDRRLDRRRV